MALTLWTCPFQRVVCVSNRLKVYFTKLFLFFSFFLLLPSFRKSFFLLCTNSSSYCYCYCILKGFFLFCFFFVFVRISECVYLWFSNVRSAGLGDLAVERYRS